MFAFATVVASEEKFRSFALPGIQRVAEPDSVVADLTDAASMCSAYNEILDAFAERDDLEALVLLHEDTEICDPDFCAKIRARFADPDIVAVGVAGARDVTSLRWWEATTRGRVTETRGHLDFGGYREDVETIDGLLMVLSPWAVRNLRFDADTFDGFHAYDVDFAFSARAAGKRVVVEDITVLHHAKGGYGDEPSFARAEAAFAAKWFPLAGRLADLGARPVESDALAENHAALRRLEDACERLAAAERWEDAAACAQVAGHLGWMNHPGVFASSRIEDVLRDIARDVLPPAPAAPGHGDGPERVLHVLTEGYDTGGHTRLAWRWMQQDAGRWHSAVLTRQRSVPSERLREAVAAAGGGLTTLMPNGPILERAAALRFLAAQHDRVVVHAHPDDPVPALALAAPGLPPVVFCNHADHVFWLGRDVAHALVSPRAVGTTIAVERRGMPAARCSVLEVPLGGARAPGLDRAAARRQLGLPENGRVLLTVGERYKYEPVAGVHLLDVVEPVVARHPDTVLVAIGPDETARWRDARMRTGGRILALGRQTSLDAFYAAADVYLESYPCSSVTAVAEAASHAVPVLSFDPDPDQTEVFGSTPVAGWRRASTPDHYAELLEELLGDAEARARWGAAAADVVAAAADSARWSEMVEEVYARAAALGPVDPAELTVPAVYGRHDLPVLRAHRGGGLALAADDLGRRVAQLELAAAVPAVRELFGSLSDHVGRPGLLARLPVALAAPSLDPACVGAVVRALRWIARAGIAERCVITVAPEDVAEAMPMIEASLADGGDFPLDLVPADEPRDAAERALLVTAPGDRFGDAEEHVPSVHAPGPAVALA